MGKAVARRRRGGSNTLFSGALLECGDDRTCSDSVGKQHCRLKKRPTSMASKKRVVMGRFDSNIRNTIIGVAAFAPATSLALDLEGQTDRFSGKVL